MATVKFRKDNEYSVVDLEYVSAEYSGAGIHAQELELDATDFATDVAENGMCLVVANGVVTKPDKISDHVCLLATEPEIYEEGKGRKSFAVKRDKGSQPRLFEIVRGDVFSTNAATYDSTEYADLDAVKAAAKAGTAKAIPSTDGLWDITATVSTATVVGTVREVVKLSNGETGVRIEF